MLGIIKRTLYHIAKYTGLFWLARRRYRKKIRFLCYHGFEIEDETRFQPKLFIRPDTFEARLRYIKDRGYKVITLDEAVNALRTQNIPDDAVVLTIDDGFFSVYSQAAPLLKRFDFPATLYLTSYYFDRDCPIYPLAVKYMFWSSRREFVDLSSLDLPEAENSGEIQLDSAAAGNAIQRIVDYGQSLQANEDRIKILMRLGLLLGVDYEGLDYSRVMGLINEDELQRLTGQGVNIQLHTHRHNFPLDISVATDEIVRNREKVEMFLDYSMRHFCYPSGLWSHQQAELLAENQIVSATTCLPGLMDEQQDLYAIPRFLDGSNISQIEFESELAGFSELCRKLKPGKRLKATQ